MNIEKLWISLAELSDVSSDQEVLGKGVVGFTNVLGYAKDEKCFRGFVERYFDSLGLKLSCIEDIDLYDIRIETFQVDDEIKSLRKDMFHDKSIKYSTIHVYEE